MREIGSLSEEQQAHRFADYLLTRGMKANVEERDGDWVLWIVNEDHVPEAKKELAEFEEDANNPRYTSASQQAETLRKQTEQKNRALRKREVKLKERWERPVIQACPVTITLMVISIGVSVLTSFGQDIEPIITELTIAPIYGERSQAQWQPQLGLQAIREGEVWRLLTPMFIHWDIMHILFNMLMLYQLGRAAEFRLGSLRYLVIVLAMSVVSNLAQYAWSGPFSGGMSGVLYGLFGFMWMKSRYDPGSGFYMPPNVVFMLMAWYVLCFTGALGPIGNAAHTGGLIAGVVIAMTPIVWRQAFGR